MSTRYETLARVAAGGMATVFVGRARGAVGFSRLVAIKRAHPHVREDAHLAEGLAREARVASQLHHPNIVSVVDVEETDGELSLVLDYVEGCTLSEWLGRRGTQPCIRETVRVLLDAAAGLDAAHRATAVDGTPLGVVHRDVSPSNVLIGVDGIARIADFGVAKAADRAAPRTETGVLKGKIAYMAPEYVEYHRADAFSDQFSFAVVVWEALAGVRLFKGTTEVDTLRRVMSARAPRLSTVDPALAPFDPVVERALARHPSDRHPSVGKFAADLELAARSYGLVATHADVATSISTLFVAELTERRRLVQRSELGVVATPPPPRGRDEIATGSLAGAQTVGDAPGARLGGPVDAPATVVMSVASRTEARASRRSLAGFVAMAVIGLVVGVGVTVRALGGARPADSRDASGARTAGDVNEPSAERPAVAITANDGVVGPTAAEPIADAGVVVGASPSSSTSGLGVRPGNTHPRRAVPVQGARPASAAADIVPRKAPRNPYKP